MQHTIKLLVLLFPLFILNGCDGESEGSEGSAPKEAVLGWHFQGRDCLACHNVDLGVNKYLLFGGTLYKDKNVTHPDNLAEVCGGNYVVEFWDTTLSTLIESSKNHEDPNSKGYKGSGNLFILQRKLINIGTGGYIIRITDKNGNEMALSSKNTPHNFNAAAYDINNPTDTANTISCNACHRKDGIQKPIYVNNTTNINLCQ